MLSHLSIFAFVPYSFFYRSFFDLAFPLILLLFPIFFNFSLDDIISLLFCRYIMYTISIMCIQYIHNIDISCVQNHAYTAVNRNCILITGQYRVLHKYILISRTYRVLQKYRPVFKNNSESSWVKRCRGKKKEREEEKEKLDENKKQRV